jgi:hypothetical protein
MYSKDTGTIVYRPILCSHLEPLAEVLMPSPFPGMDPYLEAEGLWAAFHHHLIMCLYQILLPGLVDRYRARVCQRYYDAGDHTEHREEYVEIRQRSDGRLVTLLDIVSPANKTAPAGREAYLATRRTAGAAGVNLVEIDLVLQGQPMLEYSRDGLPDWDYAVTVTRATQPERYEIYTATLQKRLPRFRLSLAPDDRDTVVDLQIAFTRCYDQAGFARRIDYRREPPVSPKEGARRRLDEVLRANKLGGMPGQTSAGDVDPPARGDCAGRLLPVADRGAAARARQGALVAGTGTIAGTGGRAVRYSGGRRGTVLYSRAGWPSCSGPDSTCVTVTRPETSASTAWLWPAAAWKANCPGWFSRPRRTRRTSAWLSTCGLIATNCSRSCANRGWTPPTGGRSWRSASGSSCARSGAAAGPGRFDDPLSGRTGCPDLNFGLQPQVPTRGKHEGVRISP